MGDGVTPLLLAVDGGNSKTDVLLADADGHVLGRVRGGPFRPQVTGVGAALDGVDELIAQLMAGSAAVARLSAFVAGADLPSEERDLAAAVAARGWAERVDVANDTFAVLHAGSESGWGVAVVCGTGINCVGLAPDGRTARFPALGAISGDWGGGIDLGAAVLWHAARDEDGRGPATALAAGVRSHFGRDTVAAVTEALHTGALDTAALPGLTRPLFAAASAGDPVALSLLDRQADEIVAMGVTALRRLALHEQPVEVVLGGGILAAGHPRLAERVAAGFATVAPGAVLRTVHRPPVVGAALHALATLHTAPETLRAARSRLLDACQAEEAA
ncbi:N-acetylglucosamine kinase-like BadF-type ATPase [Catenulispora sp. GP43]|uniref:N-acetylglucosamine kinase n=1 Tax=Catenulispora sp. GP43 TaxID=3156263 RepID=UPI00351781E0